MAPQRKPTDKPILWLTRQPQGLVATTPYDLDMIERHRIGAKVICTIEQPRDEILNRKFHALISDVAKGTGVDFEGLKSQLMIKAGFFHSVDYYEGVGTGFTPRRVSELRGDEFQECFWRIVEIILTEHLPHITDEQLLARINKYIGVRDL
jgi:hypothetical protein